MFCTTSKDKTKQNKPFEFVKIQWQLGTTKLTWWQFACHFSILPSLSKYCGTYDWIIDVDNDSCDFNHANCIYVHEGSVECNNVTSFDTFSPVDSTEIHKIISRIPNKTSPLDPLPTWLLTECADIVIPFITSLVSNSFVTGIFPSVLKEAVITPLIKKSTLNPDMLKNYRPVSNLPTLGKILEYPAVSRLNEHL